MKRGIMLIALLAAGCSPKLVQSSPAGGMINMAGVPGRQGKSAEIATAECAKHGKDARVTGQDMLSNTATYECVDK